MSRRYLTLQEAESSLNRGKTVEVFLGSFAHDSAKCIRWVSFSKSASGITGSLWEAFDQGTIDYLDVYTFDPLSGEYDEPTKLVTAENLKSAALALKVDNFNFVNQGMVQDEYADYLSSSI
ncbi:hypothetical protein [Motilimonas sp. KMU-193]|uniref:hypothetical protein n=1 Tax=Motilimonas sp. KMU-193 TaxID=3388668 RepID=UPI00396B02BB